jgi:protein phosphatase 1L
MMLYTVRFFCSVVAAFARLVRELRKAIAMAASSSRRSPVLSASAAVAVMSPPVGLIATTPLPLRKTKVVATPEMNHLSALAPLSLPPTVVAPDAEVEPQQEERKRKKTAWSATRRPSRLVIPVADDASEVAAGWGAAAAAKEADVQVEGDGFWVASRAGPRHAMEDAYSVITGKNGGADSQLVRFFFFCFWITTI